MLPSCLHQNPKRRLKKEGTGRHAARACRYAPLSESAGPGLGKVGAIISRDASGHREGAIVSIAALKLQ